MPGGDDDPGMRDADVLAYGTAEQRRDMYARWARDEHDPEYRDLFRQLAMTPGERRARWWRLNWPTMAVTMTMCVMAGLIVLALAL